MNSSLFTHQFIREDLVFQNRIVLAPLTRSRAGKERIPTN